MNVELLYATAREMLELCIKTQIEAFGRCMVTGWDGLTDKERMNFLALAKWHLDQLKQKEAK